MRKHPHLYEINTRTFVTRMSAKYGRALTLDTIPDEEWRSLGDRGFDLVWLMGVWQRSPLGRQIALLTDGLHLELDIALPDWTPDDVAGSAYAVYDYSLDPSLGQPWDLASVKAKLNHLGMGLVLDFVPNHLALDHPWTLRDPSRFVVGSPVDLIRHPDWFFTTASGAHLAHGRDPYFAPWHDTVQVNFFSPTMRRAYGAQLERISEVCDGVRCDMAMLALNEVFERVWGETLGGARRPRTEFWRAVIDSVKKRHPGFVFLAEVYWGLDRRLQELGFDFTYDKTLYDCLFRSDDRRAAHCLTGDEMSLERSVHFIENHDEQRAVSAFGRERSMAAATVIGTTPGLRFYHDGQLEGRRLRVPVHLARDAPEKPDPEVAGFYERLLGITDEPAFHDGKWELIEARPAWHGNESHRSLLTWCWRYGRQWKIIAVNYSPHPVQGWLKLPPLGQTGGEIKVFDRLDGAIYVRDIGELATKGLYVDLKPYRAHIMDATL